MSRRMALLALAHSESRLPAEYQEVKYIQGKITENPAYIDTLFVPTINTVLQVKFSQDNQNQYGFFGARNDPYRFYCATFSTGSQLSCGMTVNTWPSTRVPLTSNKIYDCTVADGTSNINGTSIITPTISAAQWSNSIGTIQLWSLNAAPAFNKDATAKYYLCKIWEDNVLVRDFVPCYRKSDNEVGMFDLVGMSFYTNAGVGSLIAGPDVN